MSRDMPAPDQNPKSRQSSFFGRRKGHKLRPHQAGLVEHLLPTLALDIAMPAPQRLAALFEAAVSEVRLEIGFGGGEHLLAEARAHSDTGFIGCEPYLNGLAKILARLEAEPAHNLKLYAGDAAELLAWLPAA